MNPDFDGVGRAFVQAYYEKFGSDRTQLVAFYQEDSLLTYEGSQTQGLEGISELYKRLSFSTVQIDFTAIDCQPRIDGCVVIFVLGQLITDEDPVKGFSQMFVLSPTAGGSWYIQNDIFRLNLHNL